MKKLSLTLVVALIGFTSIFAQPEPGMGRGNGFDGKPGFRREAMKDALNLTEAQSTKMDQMFFEAQESRIETRAQIQTLKLKIHKMMATEKVDADKLIALNKQLVEIRSAQQLKRTNHWLEVYNLLDENQKKIWTDHYGRFGKFNDNDRPMRKGQRNNRQRGMRGNYDGSGPMNRF